MSGNDRVRKRYYFVHTGYGQVTINMQGWRNVLLKVAEGGKGVARYYDYWNSGSLICLFSGLAA